ncbi:MAG: hypothetical protein ABSD12_18650 [Paraburkholderia sp.]|jgi:FPC/CPF motif-containing protein YcgG
MAISPESKQSKAASTPWTTRILNVEASNSGELPTWWRDAYRSYRETLEQPEYPCFFGQTAERRGEMFYAFDGERPEVARATMRRFVEFGRMQPCSEAR